MEKAREGRQTGATLVSYAILSHTSLGVLLYLWGQEGIWPCNLWEYLACATLCRELESQPNWPAAERHRQDAG